MKNKILYSFSIIILAINVSFSQKVDYDNIFKTLQDGDEKTAYDMLLKFQKLNPDFANTYFQLAILSEKRAKDYDPLTETEFVEHYIYNTELYYGLASLKIKDEKRRNKKYYENVKITDEEKFSYGDVLEFINKKISAVTEMKKNVKIISGYFNKTVDKYNLCVDVFKDINAGYAKIKNIYLSEDKKLEEQITELKTEFDSVLFYFKQYKSAIQEYPIKDYNQNYDLKDIITYRLDGLTGTDFLRNNIQLWNYKKWVEEVNKVVSQNIKTNRNSMLEVNAVLDNKIKILMIENYSDNIEAYKPDKAFFYKLEKYDYNSLPVKLFKYKQAKIDFLAHLRKTINDPANNSYYTFKTRALYYYNLHLLRNEAMNKKNIFQDEIKPQQIRKYQKFFVNEYGGFNDVKKYASAQDLFYKNKIKSAFNTFKTKIINEIFYPIGENTEYKFEQYNITPYKENNLKNNYFYAENYNTNKKGDIYISGFQYVANNKKPFTAMKKQNHKFQFLTKITNLSSVNNTICSYNGGCFHIGLNEISEAKNLHITKIDSTGKVVSENKIDRNGIPQIASYDEINDELILVLKNSESEKNILFYTPAENKINFETILKIKGDVFNIMKSDKNYLIFSTVNVYTDTDGTQKTVDNSNILLTIVNNNGKIKENILYKSTKACRGLTAEKLTSNTINILGIKSKPENNINNNDELLYIIIDSAGKEVYTNWHD